MPIVAVVYLICDGFAVYSGFFSGATPKIMLILTISLNLLFGFVWFGQGLVGLQKFCSQKLPDATFFAASKKVVAMAWRDRFNFDIKLHG